MKFDMLAHDLHTVLSDASAFMSADTTLPVLNAVRLETVADGDTVNLLAIATDRFTLGVSRATTDGDTGIGVTIGADSVKTVIRMAKTAVRAKSWRRVTVEISDDNRDIAFAFTSGESITVRASDNGEFPRWRQLLPGDDTGMDTVTAGLGLDPAKLAQFAKVGGKNATMQLFARVTTRGEHKSLGPVYVTIGENFIGLVMPKRVPGDGIGFGVFNRPVWSL